MRVSVDALCECVCGYSRLVVVPAVNKVGRVQVFVVENVHSYLGSFPVVVGLKNQIKLRSVILFIVCMLLDHGVTTIAIFHWLS